MASKTPEERFKSFITVNDKPNRYVDTPCYLWNGPVDRHGYGKFSFNRQQVIASRWAYENFIGPIPAKALVLHNCHQRNCVNHEHLRLGTAKDNAADAKAIGMSLAGERNPHHKLSTKDIQDIRFMWINRDNFRALGMRVTQRGLCAQYNLSKAQMSRICNNLRWETPESLNIPKFNWKELGL